MSLDYVVVTSVTRDDLADLAVDELVEMAGIDEERAKALISVARAHWFEE